MNDKEIERELARLTPAAPSAALLARLYEARGTTRRVIRFPRWIPLAAAACAVFLLVLLRPGAPPTRPTLAQGSLETFQPVETDRYLVSAHDLGVVELHPGRPYRLLRCVWADRETFRSERGTARLEVRQAREQIIPVPLEAI